MNQSDDNGSLLFLGGVIAVVAVGALVLKAVEAFFNQLGKTFDAFGGMVFSFFPMLLKILVIAGLVGAIIFCAVGGIYFSVRYVRMVKRATELQEYVRDEVQSKLAGFRADFEVDFTDKVKVLTSKTVSVEQKLDALLKPASAVAPTGPALLLNAPQTEAPVNDAGSNLNSIPSDTKAPDASEAQIPVSQPY